MSLNHVSAVEAYAEIITKIAPEALELFQQKAMDYSGGPAFLLLGARGQFSDMTRKWVKLYASVWEGKDLSFEQAEEICQDLIGNCLLMIYCLRHDQ